MTDPLLDEIRDFLKNAHLSNYEIDAYITLLTSKTLTAKEISRTSGVPTGRVYEVLEVLNDRELIVMEDSRPKKYHAINFNVGFHRLINEVKAENVKKLSALIQKAKELESRIQKSELNIKQEGSPVFWSTAFGTYPILSLYNKALGNLKEEFLSTGFLNEKTLKVLPHGKDLYNGIANAVERGVQVKYLWSFEYDDRPLTEECLERIESLFNDVVERLERTYNLSTYRHGFQMKFIERRLPTYYDIFDASRVIIKLQNPLDSNQIYACMGVVALDLAKALREKFLSLWTFEASDSPSLEYPR